MNADNNNHADTDEQEQEATSDAAARRARRRRLISVLEGFDKIPFRSRNKTDELVDHFLVELGDDVHDMLCENHTNPDSDNYRGLDSERDTESEVEAIVRFFPEVLSRRKQNDWNADNDDDDDSDDEEDPFIQSYYPIQYLACVRIRGHNVKAVSFIPLVNRLAIELGVLFDGEGNRGGLLCKDVVGNNVLHYLMRNSARIETHNREYLEPIDDKYLQVLIQLRRMGLLEKEDIQEHLLLHDLCHQDIFSEKRFRFLVEWDPSLLIDTHECNGWLPLHSAAGLLSSDVSIQGFQLVFEAGIKFFPKRKGINLLFRKTIQGYGTPFQYACKKFGREKVLEVVEGTLIRYTSLDNTPTLNINETLIMAAIDEKIHLDCVYFLMRREPDILQKLLLSSSSSSITTESTETILLKVKPKKRKRKDKKNDDDDHDGT
jgi:hypothetical protein